MMMPSAPICPRCGGALLPSLEGLCPTCLLGVGLEPSEPLSKASATQEPEHLPSRLGDYLLVEKLGEGGMGVVYKARDLKLERTVALKRIAQGELASDEAVARFLDEARHAAALDHRNIVPIYEVGQHEGLPYFTMRLMEGGSLADHLQRFRSPRRAAELVATIADAVHHGHTHPLRRILHRDLKPANLLLDAHDVPHVADFGVAQALSPKAGAALHESAVGAPAYVAPEQAFPQGRPLTTAADIYSLGVILYELLTGRQPFEAESLEELLAQHQHAEPLAPHLLKPSLSRDLETICLKCLEKEPTRRYGSAAELAADLRRYLADEPIMARPPSLPGRAWRWCRRHPLATAALLTLIWSLSVATVGTLRIASAQENELRDKALQANLDDAERAAGIVLHALVQYSHHVERAVERPELVEALKRHDVATLQSFCDSHFQYDAPDRKTNPRDTWLFHRCFIQNTTGSVLARWPPSTREFINQQFEWRDYFLGARGLASTRQRAAYVSRAFQNSSDGSYSFAISAPVYDSDGIWLGVLVVTVSSNSALGALPLKKRGEASRIALVSAMDRVKEQYALPGPNEYTVFIDERLAPGSLAPLDHEVTTQLEQTLPKVYLPGPEQLQFATSGASVLKNSRDPVTKDPGPWLAAFAPVGRTALAVIVQTPDNVALESNLLLARRILSWIRPLCMGLLLIWAAFGWSRYRTARQHSE